MDSKDSDLKDLGLDNLFTVEIPYDEFFITEYYMTNIHGEDTYIRGELNIYRTNGGLVTSVSYTHTPDWTVIEGSLVERKIKILHYLADKGFKPAASALRALKIEHLLA